jgi:hypothetical protein
MRESLCISQARVYRCLCQNIHYINLQATTPRRSTFLLFDSLHLIVINSIDERFPRINRSDYLSTPRHQVEIAQYKKRRTFRDFLEVRSSSLLR